MPARAKRNRLWSLVVFALLAVLLIVSVAAAAAALPSQSFPQQNVSISPIFGIDSFFSSKPTVLEDRILSQTRSVSQDTQTPSLKTSGGAVQSSQSRADGKISWLLHDSRGNEYSITIDEDIASNAQVGFPLQKIYLETSKGDVMAVRNYGGYVQPLPELSQLADQIYEKSDNDYQFISEVWHVVTDATRYTPDQGSETVSLPIDTLLNSAGDCEDLTILIAAIIWSSSYTQDWDLKLVYFDAHDPQNAKRVNHLALLVDTGEVSTFVESTAKSDGLKVWDKVNGWYIDI